MTIILKGVKVVGVYEMPNYPVYAPQSGGHNPPQIPQQAYLSKGASERERGKLYVIQGGKKTV